MEKMIIMKKDPRPYWELNLKHVKELKLSNTLNKFIISTFFYLLFFVNTKSIPYITACLTKVVFYSENSSAIIYIGYMID